MNTDRPYGANGSIARHLRLAIVALCLLVAGLGGWAATTELSGAIIASGRVVVDANVKSVQHPYGGVVSTIHVRNGDRVSSGQVLLSLDATVVKANLAVLAKAMDGLVIRQRRLEAERDGRETFTVPAGTVDSVRDGELADLLQSEIGVFLSRRQARAGQRAQLQERIVQLEQQSHGQQQHADALAESLSLFREELVGVERLFEQKLASMIRVMELKRQYTDKRGQHAQTIAEIARSKGQIAEIRLQMLQIDEKLMEEVTGELRAIREKLVELGERKTAALDQVQRIDIRSPADGIVHQLGAHTIGGVIEAGATIMLVVPENDELSIEVRVEGQDRDQIHVGQTAMLRLTAFNQRSTPELKGEVSIVAADLVQDPQTGMHYYPVRITVSESEIGRLGGQVLSPGMPVESFVQTSYRTVLSYLLKPVSDYLARAFRTD